MGGGNLHRTPAAGVSRSVRSYALALCMAFAIAAVPVQAQVKNITLKASNTPVSTVMQQIEEQSGYTFFYNTKDIPLDRNVTLSVANKDIRAALDELFRNTNVSYSIDNKSIILSARGGAQPQQASQITGRIVDKNGVPVIGATIMISGTTQGTTSGVDGTFALQSNVSPAGMVLDVSFIGYKPQRISVNNRTSLSVTLEEDDQQIEAVVVTALGIKRQERAVSYNVQKISDEVFLTRDANMVNSLAGKIAGVTINASAAGVGGETKVVMRGSKSIAGSNNALYVLDGIPLPSLSLTNPGDEFTIPTTAIPTRATTSTARSSTRSATAHGACSWCLTTRSFWVPVPARRGPAALTPSRASTTRRLPFSATQGLSPSCGGRPTCRPFSFMSSSTPPSLCCGWCRVCGQTLSRCWPRTTVRLCWKASAWAACRAVSRAKCLPNCAAGATADGWPCLRPRSRMRGATLPSMRWAAPWASCPACWRRTT